MSWMLCAFEPGFTWGSMVVGGRHDLALPGARRAKIGRKGSGGAVSVRATSSRDHERSAALSRLMFEGPEAELTATQNNPTGHPRAQRRGLRGRREKGRGSGGRRGIRSASTRPTSRRLRWHRPKRRNWCGGAAS